MATLREADAARRHHADSLAKAGVHAVGVEPGDAFGHKGYVVVAHVEPNRRVELPETIATPRAHKRVPLVVSRGAKFQPQKYSAQTL
jgi:hypothetical protein